ncbi:MAG: hypothetical protein QOC93_2986 [Actinomycetota bacterium]|jgi:hypothetical protein|nr:hypothetical protein [Actinomycetota bacterium]
MRRSPLLVVSGAPVNDYLPIAGPYRQIDLPGGGKAPFYIIPFDKDGACIAPVTRADLLKTLEKGAYTDVFLCSHGWNNTWPSAVGGYEDFITGYADIRAKNPLSRGQEYRPLLIGIFWPSAVLVARGEQAPKVTVAPDDEVVARTLGDLEEVAAGLPPDSRARLYELAQRPDLSEDQAADLAGLVAPLWGESPDTDDLGALADPLALGEVVRIWEALSGAYGGEVDEFSSGPTVVPDELTGDGLAQTPSTERTVLTPALFEGIKLSSLNPIALIRGTTVLLMKDRAGRVGARGVHDLLAEVLTVTPAHVHLAGHSYGCKVILSALCRGSVPRPVESVLLLQPAISHLCFADDVPGLGAAGGYRAALDPGRSVQPILTTFSSRDFPLRRVFHLIARRQSDLGENTFLPEVPGRYAALGGFGPGGCGARGEIVSARDPGDPYPFDQDVRVIGIESSRVIRDHSDISNPATCWMLVAQVDHED